MQSIRSDRRSKYASKKKRHDKLFAPFKNNRGTPLKESKNQRLSCVRPNPAPKRLPIFDVTVKYISSPQYVVGEKTWRCIIARTYSRGFFKNAQGLRRLDAGSRAGLTSSRPPPPWTSRYFNCSYFCTVCGLEKLGLVDQNWLERNLSALLLRTLVVSRRQQSESIEAALDICSKEV